MPLKLDAARQAVETRIAKPLGLDPVIAADGIVKIVNSQMVEALRLVTVARGEDPRAYAMVAFGGCGPVHAAKLAEELRIARVIVPAAPGVASAMGLLVSDLKRDYLRTRVADLEEASAEEVQAQFEELEKLAIEELAAGNIPAEQIRFERALDLRYTIQKYELAVPVAGGTLKEREKIALRGLFDERHEQQYGTRAADQKVEIVNYHLTAKLPLPRPEPRKLPFQGEDSESAKGFRHAYFDGWLDCPVTPATNSPAATVWPDQPLSSKWIRRS